METTTTQITVQATINAPVEKVWKAWNEPELIKQWAFASPDWHAPYVDNDLRVGGNFKTTMAAKDGSFSFDFGGTYTEVEQYSLIAYSLGDSRKVKVVFEKDGDATKVTETFDPENINPREMQEGGWQAILNNFKAFAEANA